MAQGLIPYLDYWDHKTPFIHYFSYLFYLLFDHSYFGGIFISISIMIASVIPILYMIFKNNLFIGILLTLFFPILLHTNDEWVMMGESYCFIFSTISIFFLFHKDVPTKLSCFIGLSLLAFSFSIKQLIVFDCMIIIIYLLKYWSYWKYRLVKFLILSISSFSSVIIINLVPLILDGSLSSFIPCFLHNFGYSAGRLGFNLKTFDLSHSLPLFGCILLCICSFLKTIKCREKNNRELLIVSTVLLWLLGSWYMSNGTHEHYMITLWQPFIFSFYYLSTLLKSKIVFYLNYKCLLPFLIIYPLSPILSAKFDKMVQKPELYSIIEAKTKSTDSYFCFSNHNGGTLLHLNRTPSSKYAYLAPIAHPGGDEHLNEILNSLENDPPTILIITELDDFIKKIKNFRILHQYLSNMAEEDYIQLEIVPQSAKLPLTDIHLEVFYRSFSETNNQNKYLQL